MRDRISIVFIGHDSSLTGAPILLLNLLEILSKTSHYEVKLILARGGPLEENYRKILPVFRLKPANYGGNKSIFRRLFQYFQYRYRLNRVRGFVQGADILFSNTIANGNLLKALTRLAGSAFLYIHELESVISYFNRKKLSDLSLKNVECIICPSMAVAENLIINHGISVGMIEYLPYYIPCNRNVKGGTIDILSFRREFFIQNQIPENKFYVGGMGTATYRKGIDLFFDTCRRVCHRDQEICFIWIGDYEEEEIKGKINAMAKEYGLEKNFFVTGKLPNSPFNPSPFDVFFLSSREDPYPLVVLEAAMLGIPSLYFKDSGGISEFIGSDAGWPLESFNTQFSSEEIIRLKKDKNEIRKKGDVAAKKFEMKHGRGDFIVSKFDEIVRKRFHS